MSVILVERTEPWYIDEKSYITKIKNIKVDKRRNKKHHFRTIFNMIYLLILIIIVVKLLF